MGLALTSPLAACLAMIVSILVLVRVTSTMVSAVFALAERYDLPRAITGALLAASATSAPELGTNLFAVLAAEGDAAGAATASVGVGVIVGSAVFNLTIVVALVGFVGAARIERRVISRDGLVYAGAVLLTLGALHVGEGTVLSRAEALLLVGCYLGYLWWLTRAARGPKGEGYEETSETLRNRPLRAGAVLVVTIALIGAACHVLVVATETLTGYGADALGIGRSGSSALLSLGIIAAATSLPDALTSLDAARRGEGSVAVANAIGSNTFDILVAMGLPIGIVGGQAITRETSLAAALLFVATVATLAIVGRRQLVDRGRAVALCAIYAGFVIALVGIGFAGER